jgi:hypothetical protein
MLHFVGITYSPRIWIRQQATVLSVGQPVSQFVSRSDCSSVGRALVGRSGSQLVGWLGRRFIGRPVTWLGSRLVGVSLL